LIISRDRLLAGRAGLLLALVLSVCVVAQAASEETPLSAIRYRLSMPRPASHLFEVQIEVEAAKDAPAAAHLDFQMPRWSPGRYSVFDFAKNVQEFLALAGPYDCPDDRTCIDIPLPVTRLDDQTWRVETGGNRKLTVSYKVFADNLSGTFSQLNERHANYNGASVFMYIVGHKPDPVRLRIEPPAGWRIVNGWSREPEQREWHFPNYDLLIDTPTEIAPDWTLDQFNVDGKTYRVVVHSAGAEGGKRGALVREIERIVRAETAMWGTPELDSYTFLLHFSSADTASDGMEHLTSTQIIMPGSLADPGIFEWALDAVAHEFFHVWNVKRLRPVELGPWDFTKPLSTRSLWIAEGVTNYYGHLMQRRAGVWTDKQLLETFGVQISEIENAPGSRLMSAEESSVTAPFQDGAAHTQRTNLDNTSVSYYTKGEVLALVLDLLIRRETAGRASLDDVMRLMYKRFYVESPAATYYLRGRGYTSEDFERTASEVAGRDLRDFFRRYVRGVEIPPYDEALETVGLRLVRAPPRKEPNRAQDSLGSQDSTNAPPVQRYDYRIEEKRDTSPQARSLRAAWMKG
jgi:predicted metalloprotease with PDZ domain